MQGKSKTFSAKDSGQLGAELEFGVQASACRIGTVLQPKG
jgi:hypothetical protein